MKHLNILLLALILLLCIPCIVLPIIGANGIFAEFRIPYSASDHHRLLVNHLIGPAFMTFFSLTLLVVKFAKRQLAWWAPSLGVLGALHTAFTAGKDAHDFSHVIFKECSDAYGTRLGWISTVIILAFIGICHLDRAAQRRQRSPIPDS